mgnify:CR=1 FL=1
MIGLANAELIAVLTAVTGNEPKVMTIRFGEFRLIDQG